MGLCEWINATGKSPPGERVGRSRTGIRPAGRLTGGQQQNLQRIAATVLILIGLMRLGLLDWLQPIEP
jgi:hypothetical protein